MPPNILIRHFNNYWISIIIVLAAPCIRYTSKCTNDSTHKASLPEMRLASISQVFHIKYVHDWPPRARQSRCGSRQTRLRDMRKRSSAQMQTGSYPVVDKQWHDERIFVFAMNVCVHSFVHYSLASLARIGVYCKVPLRWKKRFYMRTWVGRLTSHGFFGHAVFLWALRRHVTYHQEIW